MLGLCLISDSLHPFLELLLIKKIVVLERVQVAIEFEHERASCGNIISNNVSIGHLGEMLHDGSERVSMGDDDNSLSVKDLGANLIVPVRKNSIDSDLE